MSTPELSQRLFDIVSPPLATLATMQMAKAMLPGFVPDPKIAIDTETSILKKMAEHPEIHEWIMGNRPCDLALEVHRRALSFDPAPLNLDDDLGLALVTMFKRAQEIAA